MINDLLRKNNSADTIEHCVRVVYQPLILGVVT
jgi:hypothetical protein